MQRFIICQHIIFTVVFKVIDIRKKIAEKSVSLCEAVGHEVAVERFLYPSW